MVSLAVDVSSLMEWADIMFLSMEPGGWLAADDTEGGEVSVLVALTATVWGTMLGMDGLDLC